LLKFIHLLKNQHLFKALNIDILNIRFKLMRNALRNKIITDDGFSLIETVIAMTTLGVCLAYSMPLFLYAKINNSKSEIRTGAVMVSQRIFDEVRSRSFTKIPTFSNAENKPNLEYIPLNTSAVELKKYCSDSVKVSCISENEKLQTNIMGRQYQAKVTFCEVESDCAANYRRFKIEVFYPYLDNRNINSNKVYELEGSYTNFQ
jgi:type II secretory pathway pseudopilin PulG